MVDEVLPNAKSGRVAFFNGPPSTGKTSLVEALQSEVDEPWFHRSLDEFHAGIADRWWDEDEGELFEQLVVGYLSSLLHVALAGINVMAEAVIVPARRNLYQRILGETPILLIGVKCRLEVATERERRRPDRRHGPIDLPARYFETVHAGLKYDLEVATDSHTATELAIDLLPQFERLDPSPYASHLD
ncbi:MAG: hypothetical protein ABSA07_06155 [Acidimicrobiales bacterium]|jgi:chloramphenicol 3-O phosphotransferase